MTCYFPWRKRGEHSAPLLPCGQCIGCRLARSREWMARLMHEARFHEDAYFLTLTYSDEKIPTQLDGMGILCPRDLQLFWKRLRKGFSHCRIKYYACGEYGDITGRPHYHAIVFGLKLNDLVKYDDDLFTSASVDKEWGNGNVLIGSVTHESCSYVSGYIMKKLTGKVAQENYRRFGIVPEFSRMSRRPAIGKEFFNIYHSDMYPHDAMHLRGHICKPTRFYDKMFQKLDSVSYDNVKRKRKLQRLSSKDYVRKTSKKALAAGNLIKITEKKIRKKI